jgi:hypothetical protein
MLSALDSPECRELAPRLGADAFLSRWQFDPDTVMLTLQSLGIRLERKQPDASPPPAGASATAP